MVKMNRIEFLSLLLIGLAQSSANGNFKQSNFILANSFVSDGYCPGLDVWKTLTNVSIVQCGLECNYYDDCPSFNYYTQKRRICELHSIKSGMFETNLFRLDCSYYVKVSFFSSFSSNIPNVSLTTPLKCMCVYIQYIKIMYRVCLSCIESMPVCCI